MTMLQRNMREIKFRAWDKVHDKMVSWEKIISHCDRMSLFKDKNYEFMQFTGLKDKNGIEIYEGDIVKSGNGRNWEIKHGEWILSYPRDSFECYGWYMEGLECKLGIAHAKSYEIIGNIHQNPELLKSY